MRGLTLPLGVGIRIVILGVLCLLPHSLAAEPSLLDQAVQAEHAARYPEAITRLEQWLAGHPKDWDARVRLAKLYAWTKRYPEAEHTYLHVLSAHPVHLDARLGVGYVRAWTGRYEAAANDFSLILEQDSNNLDALRALAKVYLWAGHPQRARPYLQRILALAPGDQEAMRELTRPRMTSPKVEVGTTAEEFSRAGPGNVWWIQAIVPVTNRWSGIGRLEHVRRFNDLDTSGTAGVAWKGEGQGGALQFQLSPQADVLPRWNLETVWDQALVKGFYIEGVARIAEYIPARVYAGTIGLFWRPLIQLEWSARGTATATQFRQKPLVARPGFLTQFNLFTRGETLRLSPAFGYAQEPFEAGAPGAIRDFSARTYHLGAGVRLIRHWELKLDGEYEDRDDQTFVRRGQLALAYQF